MPLSLQNKPEIFPHLHLIYFAYSILRPRISVGEPNYIPLSEILTFLSELGFDESEWRVYSITLIRLLDEAYLKWWYDKHSRNGKH